MENLRPVQSGSSLPISHQVHSIPQRSMHMAKSTLEQSAKTNCCASFYTSILNSLKSVWNCLVSFFCCGKKWGKTDGQPPDKKNNSNALLEFFKNPPQKIELDSIQLLISQGADKDAKNADGEFPLELAFRSFEEGKIDFSLFKNIADALKCSELQATHLLKKFIAPCRNIPISQLEFIKFLIQKGADLNVENDQKESLLSLAYKFDVTEKSSTKEQTLFFNFLESLLEHPQFKFDPGKRFLIQILDKFSADSDWNESWLRIAGLLSKNRCVFEERDEENRDPIESALFRMENADRPASFCNLARLMIDSEHYDYQKYPNLFHLAKSKEKSTKSIKKLKGCWIKIRAGAFKRLPEDKKEEVRKLREK